ncbi:hypothetical protein [Microbispora sp. NPDC049125]|uniref:hypothetical protein n=1 Tax=Microbispora sp. NPDC049125 TaxID=3154929 RepID=UPI003466C9FD
MRYEIDDRDRAIIAQRTKVHDAKGAAPRDGDYIVFADGITRRVSETWGGEHIQTCDSGSFYLGNYGLYCSSAAHYLPVSPDTLTLTEEKRPGSVWISHHDLSGAGRGVDFNVECRVYTCTENAPEC